MTTTQPKWWKTVCHPYDEDTGEFDCERMEPLWLRVDVVEALESDQGSTCVETATGNFLVALSFDEACRQFQEAAGCGGTGDPWTGEGHVDGLTREQADALFDRDSVELAPVQHPELGLVDGEDYLRSVAEAVRREAGGGEKLSYQAFLEAVEARLARTLRGTQEQPPVQPWQRGYIGQPPEVEPVGPDPEPLPVSLRPCPFCGSAASVDTEWDSSFYVSCDNEACCGRGPYRSTLQAAIDAWNMTRDSASEPPPAPQEPRYWRARNSIYDRMHKLPGAVLRADPSVPQWFGETSLVDHVVNLLNANPWPQKAGGGEGEP